MAGTGAGGRGGDKVTVGCRLGVWALQAGFGVWSARGCIILPTRLCGAWGCSVPRLSAKVHSPCTLCSEKLRDLGRHIIMVSCLYGHHEEGPGHLPLQSLTPHIRQVGDRLSPLVQTRPREVR